MCPWENPSQTFFLLSSICFFNDTVSQFPSIWKCRNGETEGVYCHPLASPCWELCRSVSGVLNSHKCPAKGAAWRHRTKSMSTYPLGGFSHHQSTRLTQCAVICPAGALSNTYYIFLLLFTNTAALMHCETWRVISFLISFLNHCIFPACYPRNLFDCRLTYLSWGPGDIVLTLEPLLWSTHWQMHSWA